MGLTRVEYWLRLISLVILMNISRVYLTSGYGLYMLILLSTASIYYYFKWTYGRIRDLGLSRYYMVFNFIPILGQIFILIVSLFPTNYFDRSIARIRKYKVED